MYFNVCNYHPGNRPSSDVPKVEATLQKAPQPPKPANGVENKKDVNMKGRF